MKLTQKFKKSTKSKQEVETSSPAAKTDEFNTDELMADIDSVLEAVSQGEAEMFVKAYQQKGGQ